MILAPRPRLITTGYVWKCPNRNRDNRCSREKSLLTGSFFAQARMDIRIIILLRMELQNATVHSGGKTQRNCQNNCDLFWRFSEYMLMETTTESNLPERSWCYRSDRWISFCESKVQHWTSCLSTTNMDIRHIWITQATRIFASCGQSRYQHTCTNNSKNCCSRFNHIFRSIGRLQSNNSASTSCIWTFYC